MYRRLILIFASMALLSGAPATSYPGLSRITKVKQDIRAFEAVIEVFKEDEGRYPSTHEGLDVLVTPSTERSGLKSQRIQGYLSHLPNDSWDNEYQYRYPEERNIERFDLWSYGADGKSGGVGIDADFGNWPGSFDQIDAELKRQKIIKI